MIAYAELLVAPALKAGISVPPDLNNFDRWKYPHWSVFCFVQLGAPMPQPTSHWDNAQVIAAIPESEIRTVTIEKLTELGIS